jgi:CelD/BcsL family acetyltransferase involved in cellulose biosynthesis
MQGGSVSTAIEILDTPEVAAALLPEWRELWRRSASATPFQSPDWQLSWWDAFNPGELRVIAVRSHRRLIGVAPVYREEGPYGPRLLPLGISLSDYVDVLIDKRFADVALDAIASALAEFDDVEAVEWNELPPGANALRLAAPAGWASFTDVGSACPVATLLREPAQLQSVLSPSRRRHLKTARNRADRRGTVEFVRADASTTPALLAELIRLHTAAWQQRAEAGVFFDSRVAIFHAAALPQLMREEIVRLYALSIGGMIAAVYYGFRHSNCSYAYLGGYDPEFSFESPGALLLAHAMKQAICEGATEFHFLRGREAYKYEWGGRDRVNVRLTLARKAQRRAYG